MTRTARGVVFLSALVLLSARTAWSVCGDGMVDGTEQCDLGAGNGTAGTCCTNLCEFRAAGLTCRPMAGPCDIAETCTGTSATCPGDVFRPSNFICRPSAGICDVQETCTGTSAPCPADAVQPTTTFCRPSAGPCDVTDFCDGVGTACPADAKSTAECRAVAGPCDVAESCDGVNNTCPPDGFEPSTVVCRPSGGVCDVAESCTGGAAACPADAFEPSSTVCRPSAGVCDPAESCTGFTAACPGDAKSTTVCRPSAGVCDLAESCDGVNDACPSDAKSTAPCRASAGVCDVAESCDGVSDGCPADGFQPSSTVCRPAAGACDAAEQCTGSSAACPADGKSTGVCRPVAGDCDVAESCDGVSNTCPPDGFVTVGTVCRPAAPFCDVAESCTGLGPACPPNQFLPDGTACDDGISCTADACSGGACVGTPDLDVCLDEFLCYKTKISQPTTMPVVTLEDQFDTAPVSYQVVKGRHVCTPANRNGTGVNDPVTHLRSYTIKAVPGSPKFQRRTLLRVTNDLGEIRLDATKPDLLLVPVDKDLSTDPPPPMTSALDHFKCYKVKVSTGTPKFVSTAVSMTDQFTSPAKSFLLKKPRHLCNPVDKNGEGINNPTAHLLCYKAKGGIPKHVRRIGVHVNGQFGPEIVDTVKEDEICIPSAKALSPSGAFVDGMEGSLL